jgi:hypothetical protein
MGTVYLAKHPRLPRSVALKLLNREFSADPELHRRFEREADVVAQLDHPSIVGVYDRGSDNGYLWIVMQFVRGTDAEHGREIRAVLTDFGIARVTTANVIITGVFVVAVMLAAIAGALASEGTAVALAICLPFVALAVALIACAAAGSTGRWIRYRKASRTNRW